MARHPLSTQGAGHCSGNTVDDLKRDIVRNLFCVQGRFPAVATRHDYYLALSLAVRERMMHRWIHSAETYFKRESRTVAYLSAEFLIGPQLENNLINLGIRAQVTQALGELDLSLDDLIDQEEEPGLGNGGLGRLAACYMDSLATCQIPALGYGIRYEFGIFDQVIRDGWQSEVTDKWLRLGNPWELARPEVSFQVKLGGRTEAFVDAAGRYRVRWLPERVVVGTPFDTAVLGYGVQNANTLRLWKAEACESFDFAAFNKGDYYGAVHDKLASENITKVLYPNDEPAVGKELRLTQQYFFVSCSLQDMIRLYLQREKNLAGFHHKFAVQLNDTHPAIAVAELMRLLVDEHGQDWMPAWEVTRQTFGYTNHTLLPEALEKWPVGLFGRILPRHLELLYEINRRHLMDVRARFPGDDGRLGRLSLFEEAAGDREKQVRMAHLACVGSHAINGVAALHSELLKKTVLADFHALWPQKFSNKTNGVTPRRFLVQANPALARLISESIGEGWIRDLDELRRLEPLAEDEGFRARWREVKLGCKRALAGRLERQLGLKLSPESLFDVQVKRLHEYKRQHLNVLHVITLYNRLRRGRMAGAVPRTVIFGGKAAPGYHAAKLIIKLIHAVAQVVNADPRTRHLLQVAFFPDFNVKNAQLIYPAADLSEQISTAGKEASGTGNMKFSLNGALTIGTLDGANVEIRERVGAESFFLFGLTVDQVAARWQAGYRPAEEIARNPELGEVLEQIEGGTFSADDKDRFLPLTRAIREHDGYLLCADYPSYLAAQEEVARAYADPDGWARKSILNVARMGFFSSDRAIREYAKEIWRAQPVEVKVDG